MEKANALVGNLPLAFAQKTSIWCKQYRKYLVVFATVLCTFAITFVAYRHRDYIKSNVKPPFVKQRPIPDSSPIYNASEASSLDLQTISSIQNSSLGFERIMVINLPARTDKIDALWLSASLTGINFTIVPGVLDEDVALAALPHIWPEGEEPGMGAWRAHMNALNVIVRDGLSSALILEDDIDWDVNIKTQLPTIAQGTRYLGFDSDRWANKTLKPPHSPYGDDWDVLWLGHCASELRHPSARFLISNDPTVPPPSHRWNMWQPGFNDVDIGNSTRVVSANNHALCTLAYAISYAGAQKILYHMGTKPFKDPFDMGLKALCDARDKHKNDVRFECMHVWPSLMNSFRPAGKSDALDSDINEKDEGKLRKNSYVFNTVFSNRMNIATLFNQEQPKPQWDDVREYQDVDEDERLETRFQEGGWWDGDEMYIDLSAHYEKPPRYDALDLG